MLKYLYFQFVPAKFILRENPINHFRQKRYCLVKHLFIIMLILILETFSFSLTKNCMNKYLCLFSENLNKNSIKQNLQHNPKLILVQKINSNCCLCNLKLIPKKNHYSNNFQRNR